MLTAHEIQTFDAAAAVEQYRQIVARRDAAAEPDRDELELIARRLRARWAEWQGEDSLHEMAFGEPTE